MTTIGVKFTILASCKRSPSRTNSFVLRPGNCMTDKRKDVWGGQTTDFLKTSRYRLYLQNTFCSNHPLCLQSLNLLKIVFNNTNRCVVTCGWDQSSLLVVSTTEIVHGWHITWDNPYQRVTVGHKTWKITIHHQIVGKARDVYNI